MNSNNLDLVINPVVNPGDRVIQIAEPRLIVLREDLVILHMMAEDVPANADEMTNYLILATRFANMNRIASILVHDVGTRDYYVMDVRIRAALNQSMHVLAQTCDNGGFIPGTNIEEKRCDMDKNIPRPRNSFMLYRQWKSDMILEENPGITAALISQVVSNMWRTEEPRVKAHFRALASEEDRRHRAAYPQYHYAAGLRVTHAPLLKQDAVHDPMEVARRLIVGGY